MDSDCFLKSIHTPPQIVALPKEKQREIVRYIRKTQADTAYAKGLKPSDQQIESAIAIGRRYWSGGVF